MSERVLSALMISTAFSTCTYLRISRCSPFLQTCILSALLRLLLRLNDAGFHSSCNVFHVIAAIFVIASCPFCPSGPFSDAPLLLSRCVSHDHDHIPQGCLLSSRCCTSSIKLDTMAQLSSVLLATMVTSSATSKAVAWESTPCLPVFFWPPIIQSCTSLLKRGCGNHCLGRLSSCGARRKKPLRPRSSPWLLSLS